MSEASYSVSCGCTPVEIPVFVLGRLLRFPRLSRTSLARRTVPLEMLLVTGLNGRGSGWCLPCTSGSSGAVAKDGGSSGVTGAEEDGELALLVGSLGESSGTVKSRRETCSAAEVSCVGLIFRNYNQRAPERVQNLLCEGRRAS
jgi:hypothetical protein